MAKRMHRRVVRRGTEKFDVDGDEPDFDSEDALERQRKDADDDARILRELPPHWGTFDAEKGR